MRSLILFLCLSLTPVAALAQGRFEPKSYNDCLLLYAKKAKTNGGEVLIRRVCKCLFQKENAPAQCADYSKEAMDCFILNVMPVTDESQVDGIERACVKQYPRR